MAAPYLQYLQERLQINTAMDCNPTTESLGGEAVLNQDYFSDDVAKRRLAFSWLDCYGSTDEVYKQLFKKAVPGYTYTIPEIGQGEFLCVVPGVVEDVADTGKDVYIFVDLDETTRKEPFYVSRRALGTFLGKSTLNQRTIMDMIFTITATYHESPNKIDNKYISVLDIPGEAPVLLAESEKIVVVVVNDAIQETFANPEESINIKEKKAELLGEINRVETPSLPPTDASYVKQISSELNGWIKEDLKGKLNPEEFGLLEAELNKGLFENAIRTKLSNEEDTLTKKWFAVKSAEPVSADTIAMPSPGLLEGATAPKIEAMNRNLELGEGIPLEEGTGFINRGTDTTSFFRGGGERRTTRRKGLRQHQRRTKTRKQKGGGLTNYVSWGLDKIAAIPQGLRQVGESAGAYGLQHYERIFVDKSKQAIGAAYEQAMLEIKKRDRTKYDEEVREFTKLINVKGDTPSTYSITINDIPFKPESYVGKNLAKSSLNSAKIVSGSAFAAITAASYLAPSLISGGALALLVANPVVGSVVLGAVAAAIKYATANVVIGANRAYLEHTLAKEAVMSVTKSEADVIASIKEYISKMAPGPLDVFSSNQRQRSIWVSDKVVAVYGAVVTFTMSRAIKVKTSGSTQPSSMFAEAVSIHVADQSFIDCILTKKDFSNMDLYEKKTNRVYMTQSALAYYESTVLDKIYNFWLLNLGTSYKIDVKNYDKVHITSDIHADYRKLLQIMSESGLIKFPNKLNPYSKSNITGIPYFDQDIYNTGFITDTEWIPERTLFIIVGDIVDGKRSSGEVDDPAGAFEFFLHCFIYNIRIKAMLKNSDVRFVLGNHDLESVIMKNTDFAFQYVHPTTWEFFNYDNINLQRRLTSTITDKLVNYRYTILTPFYLTMPYIMLSLENSDYKEKEVAVVHGGFHSYARDRRGKLQIKNLLDEIKRMQESINHQFIQFKSMRNSSISSISSIFDIMKELSESEVNGESPLWTRLYEQTDNALIKCSFPDTLGYNLIVVGHCTTNSASYPRFKQMYSEMSDEPVRREQCQAQDGLGCVLLDCYGENLHPRMAFVDVAMSAAFRSSKDKAMENDKRNTEMLLLIKNEEFTPPDSEGTQQIVNPVLSPRTKAIIDAANKAREEADALAKKTGFLGFGKPSDVVIAEAEAKAKAAEEAARKAINIDAINNEERFESRVHVAGFREPYYTVNIQSTMVSADIDTTTVNQSLNTPLSAKGGARKSRRLQRRHTTRKTHKKRVP